MSTSENIIKKSVLRRRTNFKNNDEEKELACPVCGSSNVIIDYTRSEKICKGTADCCYKR